MYEPGAVGDPTHQQHDFEPGIAPSNLFWTIPVSPSAIEVDPATGEARLHATDVEVTDFFNFFNAVGLGGPPPVPALVSFDVRWSGHGERRTIRDETFRFTGKYVTGPARVSFTATDVGSGVLYTSDPAGQHNPSLADGGAGPPAVGHERNGIFFQ